MVIKLNNRGEVAEIKPPLQGDDASLLSHFKIPGWGTVIYVPFDPTTGQIPSQPLNGYPEKDYNGVKVRYSPNLHKIMLEYYTSYDPQRGQYLTKIPVLLVDYNTVTRAIYTGKTEKPSPRPLDMQYKDWLSGVMWGRYPINSPIKETYCGYINMQFGDTTCSQVTLLAGYWLVGYEARLLDIPAGILEVHEDVIKFVYRRPDGVAFKIPGFKSVADYVYKRKIKGQYATLEKVLNAFGLALNGEPWVEETSDGYVVYMPVKRVSSLALPAIPLWLIGLVIISVTLLVTLHYISRIESTKAENFRYYLNFLKSAQDDYQTCVANCHGDKDCEQNCAEAYNRAVNSAENAFHDTGTGFGEDIKELTALMKWAVGAIVVINLLPALTSAIPRRSE